MGHALENCHVCKIGTYNRRKFKITIIMTTKARNQDLNNNVLGSIFHPQIWYHLCTEAVTPTVTYIKFLENDVMDTFFEDEPQRTIMHGNLSSPNTPEVTEAVYKHGYRVKYWVLYCPYKARCRNGLSAL